MKIHEFTEGGKPIMLLVHGVLTPWQVWTPMIEAFRDRYDIYAVALDAHTEECASEFVSIADEVEKIVQYFAGKNITAIDTLCGISLGGKISYAIWKDGRLSVANLIMDGAPLVSCPKFAQKIMANNYVSIIHQSKKRTPSVIRSFKKNFLPEIYLESYLKIADFMTDSSMRNIVYSAFSGDLAEDVDNHSRILFIHGTRGNEVLSRKAAKLMKKYYPATEIVCFAGDAHCYKAIYEPAVWIKTVEDFLAR